MTLTSIGSFFRWAVPNVSQSSLHCFWTSCHIHQPTQTNWCTLYWKAHLLNINVSVVIIVLLLLVYFSIAVITITNNLVIVIVIVIVIVVVVVVVIVIVIGIVIVDLLLS